MGCAIVLLTVRGGSGSACAYPPYCAVKVLADGDDVGNDADGCHKLGTTSKLWAPLLPLPLFLGELLEVRVRLLVLVFGRSINCRCGGNAAVVLVIMFCCAMFGIPVERTDAVMDDGAGGMRLKLL